MCAGGIPKSRCDAIKKEVIEFAMYSCFVVEVYYVGDMLSNTSHHGLVSDKEDGAREGSSDHFTTGAMVSQVGYKAV